MQTAAHRPFIHYAGLHTRLHYLYGGEACTCPRCGGRVGLAGRKTKAAVPGGSEVEKAGLMALQHVRTRGGYKPEDLDTEKPYQDLVKATAAVFSGAIQDNKVPAEMASYLNRDGHIFSGLKTHAQLQEATALLLQPDGSRRPFASFATEVLKLNATYNRNYLEAEYLFATQSAQSAAAWVQIEKDGDRYDLQYRTAADDKVRASHAVLHNTTLPPADPFWSLYFPPNGWRCRCKAQQVRRGKFAASDPETAMAAGMKATTALDKDGKNKLQIFRFNPGKDKALMPPGHPYTKVEGAKEAEKVVSKTAPAVAPVFTIRKPIATVTDFSEVMADYAAAFPEDFKKGFKRMEVTRRNVNGSTDCRGLISLSAERMLLVMDGFNSIKKGEKTTFDQEDALATLWHEILHNKRTDANETWGASKKQVVKEMELANEFVARKTLDQFMEKIGGELQNTEFKNTRNSTGYNTMVVNYDKILEFYEVDPGKALATVQEHLTETGSYDNQMDGLVNAVKLHSPYKLTDIRSTIKAATSWSETGMENLLESKRDSLVKKPLKKR